MEKNTTVGVTKKVYIPRKTTEKVGVRHEGEHEGRGWGREMGKGKWSTPVLLL